MSEMTGTGILLALAPVATPMAPAAGAVFVYRPLDPASVTAVTLVALYANPDGTGAAVASAGPATRSADGTEYTVTLDAPDGTYFPAVTVTYSDGSSSVDRTGTLTLPAPQVRDEDAPLEPWCTPADLPATTPETDPVVAALACQVATDILWALSGRKYTGLRRVTLLAPVLPGEDCEPWQGYTPHRSLGGRNVRGSRLVDPQVRALVAVLAVEVAGVTVDPALCELREDRILLPALETGSPLGVNADPYDGARLGPWCSCCGGPGQVTVTVEYGQQPPAAGRAACVALAADLVKALTGGKCLVAGNATSVARQGVTVLLDPTAFLDAGRTGVPLADLFIAAYNPHRLAQPSTVWSPDIPLPVRL